MTAFLRPVRDDDLLMILSWRNHPQIRCNMYNSDVISEEEHLNWYAKIKFDKSKQYYIYESENIPLGVVAFTSINRSFKNSDWAFYASPEAPKGTGAKMEYLALEYAFNKLKLHKLSCEVISFNRSVIKLHQKFGFQIEGIFKEQVFINEQFHDVHRLAIFSDEWDSVVEQLKEKVFRKRSDGQ